MSQEIKFKEGNETQKILYSTDFTKLYSMKFLNQKKKKIFNQIPKLLLPVKIYDIQSCFEKLRIKLRANNISLEEALDYFPKHSPEITLHEIRDVLLFPPFQLTLKKATRMARYFTEDNQGKIEFKLEQEVDVTTFESIFRAQLLQYRLFTEEQARGIAEELRKKIREKKLFILKAFHILFRDKTFVSFPQFLQVLRANQILLDQNEQEFIKTELYKINHQYLSFSKYQVIELFSSSDSSQVN